MSLSDALSLLEETHTPVAHLAIRGSARSLLREALGDVLTDIAGDPIAWAPHEAERK